MRYFIFSNTDIIGPFKPEELLSRSDFLPTNLVCPEDKIDTDEQWKIAIEYEDFRSLEDLTEQEITQRLEYTLKEKMDVDTKTEVKDIKDEIEKKYDKPQVSNNRKVKHPTTLKIARKNNKNFFTYIVIPIILGVILIFGIYVYDQYVPKKAVPKPAVKSNVVVQETKNLQPNNANISEEIKDIVSSYYLDTNRGTVGEWFKRLFSQNIKDGYVENWLVEHLYENIYVVQYRLTKPRKEPIVYIFEIDYKDKTITSALNNATIDLLSGI